MSTLPSPERRRQQRSPQGVGSLLGRGLGRRLMIWFLFLALGPMALVGFFALEHARETLQKEAFELTRLETRLQGRRVQQYFDRVALDLRQAVDQVQNINFIAALNRGRSSSEAGEQGFVGSYDWALLVDRHAADLATLRRAYGYHDVLLIGAEGDILFTVAQESDLGSNLFHGALADTRFAAAARRSLRSGEPVFSDLEYYAPSQGAPAAFFVAPIVSLAGDKIGLMAFQLSSYQIESVLEPATQDASIGDVYLVGADRTLRSALDTGTQTPFLETVIETDQVDRWYQVHVVEGIKDDKSREATLVHIGPRGNEVLSSLFTVNILGEPWAVIAEVDTKQAFAQEEDLKHQVLLTMLLTVLLVVLVVVPMVSRIVRPVRALSVVARRVAGGDLDQQLEVDSKDEIGQLSLGFNDMLSGLRQARNSRDKEDWLKTAIADLNEHMRGAQGSGELSDNIIDSLAHQTGASVGLIYLVADDGRMIRSAGFAFPMEAEFGGTVETGQGLIGQAVRDRGLKHIRNVPAGYLEVSSGIGRMDPQEILIMPFFHENSLRGVVELGTLGQFSPLHLEFLQRVSEAMGISVIAAFSRERNQALLQESQSQAEELQNQAEALQQREEEMRTLNEELEEHNLLLVEQKKTVEQARLELEDKAQQLAQASQYKSEFLANMSHELRTPLNSLLLLARSLADNKDGSLRADQAESASVIYQSGTDLLSLINEILDLSKIEAGHMALDIGDVRIEDLVTSSEHSFAHQAQDKGIEFRIDVLPKTPELIRSDFKRIEQVIRNLVSNALKFTREGSVTLQFSPSSGEQGIDISVIDTGIGIPLEKQNLIFEAFQQADGSTSRKYGGTGLGLSISSELAQLLEGDLAVTSTPGKGAAFTLSLPVTSSKAGTLDVPRVSAADRPSVEKTTPLFRSSRPDSPRQPGQHEGPDRVDVVLLVEDDPVFAKFMERRCVENQLAFHRVNSGEEAIEWITAHIPFAVILDIGLPGMNGWQVLEYLKNSQQAKKVPVHVITGLDSSAEGKALGAVEQLQKPVTQAQVDDLLKRIASQNLKRQQRVLVVEDDQASRIAIAQLLTREGVVVETAADSREARKALEEDTFDCLVLDLGLPDQEGLAFLQEMKAEVGHELPPVVVYTGRDLDKEEEMALRDVSDAIILKDVRSEERLMDEVSLFLDRLHQSGGSEEAGDSARRPVLEDAARETLEGRRVLIIDDDLRTLFALSKLLFDEGMQPLKAEGGEKALALLAEEGPVDVILVDIMMPDMDGYEVIRRIRERSEYATVPIISVTAKAMKGDREKCLQAGASDYLTKPVDPDALKSLLRVWLSK